MNICCEGCAGSIGCLECKMCGDCKDCFYCERCYRCKDCFYCEYCDDCENCYGIEDFVKSDIFGRIKRFEHVSNVFGFRDKFYKVINRDKYSVFDKWDKSKLNTALEDKSIEIFNYIA